MKTKQRTPQERWEDNKERCKEVMSATISELAGRSEADARNLCDQMTEKGIMDFEGVAGAMQEDGNVDFNNPFILRVHDFLLEKGFNQAEAQTIVTAICEFTASTMLWENLK